MIVCHRFNPRKYDYEGQKLTIGQLSKLGGMSRNTLARRLKGGWSVKDAVELPIQMMGQNHIFYQDNLLYASEEEQSTYNKYTLDSGETVFFHKGVLYVPHGKMVEHVRQDQMHYVLEVQCPGCGCIKVKTLKALRLGLGRRCRSCALRNRKRRPSKVKTEADLLRKKCRSVWNNIKGGCYSESNPKYQYYGGKGIGVCQEWVNSFETFYQWLLDNNYSMDPRLIVSRRDKTENYTPENTIIIDRKDTMKHRRKK